MTRKWVAKNERKPYPVTHEYAVYDMQDNETLLGIFERSEVLKYLGISLSSLWKSTSQNYLIGKRYKIITIKKKERWKYEK